MEQIDIDEGGTRLVCTNVDITTDDECYPKSVLGGSSDLCCEEQKILGVHGTLYTTNLSFIAANLEPTKRNIVGLSSRPSSGKTRMGQTTFRRIIRDLEFTYNCNWLAERKPMSVPRYKAIMLMEFCNTSSRLVMNIASILQAEILLLNDPYVLQILR